jgi:hypothetical protein
MYWIREAMIVTTHLARSWGSVGGGIARNGGGETEIIEIMIGGGTGPVHHCITSREIISHF